MAIHELYLGGPQTPNVSRAMLPSAPFNAGEAAFQAMRPAAHKGPKCFNINRVFDFLEDKSLAEWARHATVAQGDVLSALILPADVVLLGTLIKVERAAGVALTLTPTLRGGAAFPAVNGNVVSKALGAPGVTPSLTATGDASTIVPFFIAGPVPVDLALTTWTGFGDLRLSVSCLVTDYEGGQW
jgi:hypothetical protein